MEVLQHVATLIKKVKLCYFRSDIGFRLYLCPFKKCLLGEDEISYRINIYPNSLICSC